MEFFKEFQIIQTEDRKGKKQRNRKQRKQTKNKFLNDRPNHIITSNVNRLNTQIKSQNFQNE